MPIPTIDTSRKKVTVLFIGNIYRLKFVVNVKEPSTG